jgi:hypothetical protein
MFKQAEGITYFSIHQLLGSPQATWIDQSPLTDEALSIWGAAVTKISDEL